MAGDEEKERGEGMRAGAHSAKSPTDIPTASAAGAGDALTQADYGLAVEHLCAAAEEAEMSGHGDEDRLREAARRFALAFDEWPIQQKSVVELVLAAMDLLNDEMFCLDFLNPRRVGPEEWLRRVQLTDALDAAIGAAEAAVSERRKAVAKAREAEAADTSTVSVSDSAPTVSDGENQ